MAPMLSTFGGGSIRGFRSSGGGPELFPVDDVMVFTSSKQMGAFGPNKAMTDDFYPYPQDYMDMFDSQIYNGYQTLTINTSGTYEFELLGAYSISANVYNYTSSSGVGVQYYQNTTPYTTASNAWYNMMSNANPGSSSLNSYVQPGRVICRKSLSEGDQIHILVGQGSIGDSEHTTSMGGAGASAVFVGSTSSSWGSAFAIAGGMGGLRAQFQANSGSTPYTQSPFSTSGTVGGNVSGSTAVSLTSGSVAGSSGGAGTNNNYTGVLSNAVQEPRAGGGAGLSGTPLGRDYFDNRTPLMIVNDAQSLQSGGQGGYSGSSYMNPQDSSRQNQNYWYMTYSNGLPTGAGVLNTGTFSSLGSNISAYANNTSTTHPNIHVPMGSHQGGFGGGSTGGWGGVGGGGGYSGGAPGTNTSDGFGGFGSSYVSGFTNVSSPSVSHALHCRCEAWVAPVIGGVTQSKLMSGWLPGNGWVSMKRVA